MTTPMLALPEPRRRAPSIALPLVLIALGLAFLLANLGALPSVSWAELFRLWPVLLVLAGVDILLRPRSFVAAAVVEIAIVSAAFIYLLSAATIGPATVSYTAEVPRAAATDLALTVSYGAGSLELAGGGSALVSVRSTREDVSRTVEQSDTGATVVLSSSETAVFGLDGRERRWVVALPSDVRTALTLNLGAGSFDIDLGDVLVTRATVNAGASSMAIVMPAPKGDVPIRISTGMSSLDLRIPSGVAYRIRYSGVLQSVSGPLSSADYDTATDRLTIELSSAMGSVSIHP